MAQNREPPAYQEYASTMLAKMTFRLMSLEARGLLYTMRLECWANMQLPSDIDELTLVLGKPVTPDILKAVKPFFDVVDNQIFSPELENYRVHLEDIRKKQSQGGKKGAKLTNNKRDPKSAGDSTGNPQVPRQGSDESLVQSSSEKQSQNQLIENDFNYLNEDGTDPLLKYMATDVVAVCSRCSGEGCDWCEPSP
jgi:hypothetical protein